MPMMVRRMVMIALWLVALAAGARAMDDLERSFVEPPEAARPWVYWYFMDGNLTREGITADLEAMKRAGIGGAIFLEVGIGIPRGPVKFMSPEWQALFRHAAAEADRLGIALALGAGPGWCGTGGPWVKPEQSMQHLVASETRVKGPARFEGVLPRPQPRTPFFGERTLTPELAKAWKEFYRDVAVLAFPTPQGEARIADADEKALYYRAPYSSRPGVKPFLPEPAAGEALPAAACIATSQVIDLTDKLGADGKLAWDAPAGEWTIMRLGRTATGQTTRPAPAPGLGFESDKFDAAALDAHYDAFIATLLKAVGPDRHPGRGLTTLHFDSWEMSSQNWSGRFREEFEKRRGYDPLRYLPALSGRVVESREVSERFLWDLRQTAQELVIENHARRLKELGHKNGLEFSIEPYDLNPCADLELGAVADVPMCEFWSVGHGFQTEFSCIEAASLAHTLGRPVVAAESFTAAASEGWLQHPASMKAQGDWAFCAGINRIAFHRYQHQPWPDRFPGMTMGPYGVHWESTQTWWPMVPAYHRYLTRCQQVLRSGVAVADILYLAPEGAPHVFRAPKDALMSEGLPDRRGYNFDGCAPSVLIERAGVKDGRIAFPGGTSYRALVLPQFETMTPKLLGKVVELAEAGATVIMSGPAPSRSPSLAGYPKCDEDVKRLAERLEKAGRRGGPALTPKKGTGTAKEAEFPDIYQNYESTARMLGALGVVPDFETDGNLRYAHRRVGEADVYFVGNRDDRPVAATCRFRVSGKRPEWWSPATGERRELSDYAERDGRISVPVRLEAQESGFVVFLKKSEAGADGKGKANGAKGGRENFPEVRPIKAIGGAWEVAFDPKWGGPEKVAFEKLEDWSKRPEPGIRNYSGRAVYRTSFDAAGDVMRAAGGLMFVSLGEVKVMASVRLNGKDLGVAWCAPWRVEIPAGTLRERGNKLEITVANLWINRLIGDAALPKEKRLAWTTWNPYKPGSPLQASGLMGPVALCGEVVEATKGR